MKRKVNSRRNSTCSVPLDRLDWSSWWTDNGGWPEYVYLHVPYKDEPGNLMNGTVHRVRPRVPRGMTATRLSMENGELYWLFDEPLEEAVAKATAKMKRRAKR